MTVQRQDSSLLFAAFRASSQAELSPVDVSLMTVEAGFKKRDLFHPVLAVVRFITHD